MIAKSLIVNGASRFLNTIYANNLSVSGTTSFASLDTTTLNVSGTSTLAGTTVTGTLRIVNTGVVSGDSSALITGNSGTGKRVRMGVDAIQAANNNTTSTLYLNYYGGVVYLSNTTKISANNGTFTAEKINAQSVMVTDELRAFKWNIQHIANLGGTFLVTPTLKCTANSATFAVTAISGTTITATINDATAITGNELGGGTWSASSKIKISGKVGGIVLGTCDGQLTAAMNATAGTLTFTFTYPNQSINALSVKTYAASEVSDLTVMLTTVGDTNPIGIYMTSYDSSGYSHISLYGGTNAKPTVRIGNLQGLDAINGVSPSGWGIYTDNGFFSGVIVSNSGKIGNFTISTALYSSTHSAYNTNVDGIYIGSDYISFGKQGVTYFKPDGTGKIGAWTVSATAFYNGKSSYSETTNDGVWLGTDGIGLGKGKFYVTNAGALTATNATITGVINATSGIIGSNATNKITIGNNATNASIYSGMSTLANTSNNGFYIGTDGIALGKGAFKVTSAGALTATSATITGGINATSGTIGSNSTSSSRWQIGSTSIYNGTNSISSTTAGTYVGTDGLRNYKDANTFVSISNGVITAKAVDLTGKITASSGAVGGWTVNTTAIFTGDNVTSNSDNYVAFSSTDFTRTINGTSRTGLRLAVGDKFGLTGDGILYANGANITSINASNISTGSLNAALLNTGKIQGTQNQSTYFDLDNADFVTQGANSAYAIHINSGQLIASSPSVEFTLYMDNDINKAFLYSEEGVAVGDGLELYNNYNKHPYIDFHCNVLTTDQTTEDYTTRIIETEPGILKIQSATDNLGNQLQIREGNLEIYHATPFIDFHHGSTANDYSTRIITIGNNQIQFLHNDGSKTQFNNGNIEIYSTTGLIDFHYGISDTADYTSRIRETASGTLKSYPGAITSGSDGALKKDIIPINTSYIDLVDKLRPVEFRYKDAPDFKHLGFIAQDIEQALNEIGIEDKPLIIPPADEDDYYALDYTQIIPMLVAYVKDLRNEINELKGE